MKKIRFYRWFTVLLCLALLTGCAAGTAPSQEAAAAPESSSAANNTAEERPLIGNQLVVDFTAATLAGGEVTMKELFAGYDVIMLNFWATFCGPCIREMPYLGEIADEYADKNVLIVGVVTDLLDANGMLDEKVLEDSRYIVQTTGADYVHLMPCEGLLPLLQQIYVVPTTVFLNAEGYQLGSAQVSALDKDSWCTLLDELLAHPEVTA